VAFLGETLNFIRICGFVISLFGVVLIAVGKAHGFQWHISLGFVLIATISGALYTVLQKPFLKKYHPIEVTMHVFWGGTIFLLMYWPHLIFELLHASWQVTATVIYLGIFPAAIAYVGWTYILSHMPASRAVSYLYAMPFVATFLG